MTPEQLKRQQHLAKNIDDCRDIINYLNDQVELKEKELKEHQDALNAFLKSLQ